MISAAVITRVQLIEAPYLNEFITWYLKLGFQKFYFINTEPQNLNAIKEFIDDSLKSKCHFTPHTGHVNKFSYARKLFSTVISEDYILHVDTDEFLVLPKEYANVQDFIEKKVYDLYTFFWVTIPITELYKSSMIEHLFDPNARYKASPARKMMVNRKVWLKDPRSVMSMHYFECKGNMKKFDGDNYELHQPFIMHFLVRGYLHTILKILAQRDIKHGNKQNIQAFLKGNLSLQNCPDRIKIAMGECYSAQLKIPLEIWNVQSLDYPKPSLDKIIKLICQVLKIPADADITTNDVFNLTQSMEKGINTLQQKNCPVNGNAGFKYLGITKKYLQD